MKITRRVLLAAPGALLLPAPTRADRQSLSEALRQFTGGQPMREGRVRLDVSPLVENGNAVPISVAVETSMTAADHVRRIGVFNERNPQPNVIIAQFGPRSGRAYLATHIRLATTQDLVAVAEMSDGSLWAQRVMVVVTLAACVEG
ncbi:MAG: SoxY-related AACIE arm protein [Alphaproteobacteria bacterium]|nr:SoxY-related AACIE arm protein [Alphaproteobacteria bacterium]